MADNFVSNPGSGGSTFAADDIGSVLYLRTKPSHGADGSATDTSHAAPLPVAAVHSTAKLDNGGTQCTPVFASVSVSAATDNAIVAAAGASNKIRVLAYTLVASGGANTVTWKSATTAKTGAMDIPDNQALVGAFCPVGLFETAANEALNLTLSGATLVAGHITYVVVQ